MKSTFPLINRKSEAGFSIAELAIVVAIIGILSSVSLFYLTSYRRLMKPNEQALQILDVLQEARQRSLTQRETVRVEIDLTDNVVRLVDENTNSTKTLTKIRQITLRPTAEVKVEDPPSGISAKPNAVMVLPDAKYNQINTSAGPNRKAFILKFKSDGTVIDTDGNAKGACIYVWSNKQNQTSVSDIALAITVEPSGLIRYWQYDFNSTASNKWRNS